MYTKHLPFSVILLRSLISAGASYQLTQDLSPSNFFDAFTFYSAAHPTNGFIRQPIIREAAGLISISPSHVTIGVDATHIYDPTTNNGRPSIRLQGNDHFTHGLVILSLNHMPFGCGTWPAFWSFGPDWPNNGEIDIIEGLNVNAQNLISLHTTDNCTVAGADETGTLLTSDCFWEANENSGCGVQSQTNAGYGEAFNAAGGGVYAMQWTSAYIRVWFWQHADVPSSITLGEPDPATFGTPSANFQGSCDIDTHFANHQLVFDTTFCGDYAGRTYRSTSCPMTAGAAGYQSCKDYVANNPSAFSEAYWEINWLRVYQQHTNSIPAPTSSSSESTSLASVTPVASTSQIKSSLASVGMGKHSSSAQTMSLVIPSSSSQHSSRGTYSGPNTKESAGVEARSSFMSVASNRSSAQSNTSTSSRSPGTSIASESAESSLALLSVRTRPAHGKHTHKSMSHGGYKHCGSGTCKR